MMRLRLVPRAQPSRAMLFVAPIIAILLTLLVGLAVFAWLGQDPLRAFGIFFIEPVSDMNGVSELEGIHTPRHLDVRKQKFDIGAGFKDRQRIVGIDGFDGGETGVLDHIHRPHTQHHFVFDNQNGAKNGRLGRNHRCPALSFGAVELARASCSLMASNLSANCPHIDD